MNLLQLVFKQMRQRALGTWLTLLSVLLGVALAVSVLLVREGAEGVFIQKDFGYDLIVGKGSPTQLVFNTVYHIDQSPGNIPYSVYENLLRHPQKPGLPNPRVKLAVPMAVGDMFKGRRIIATLPTMFGYEDDGTRIADGTDPTVRDRVLRYRRDKRFEFAQGRVFHPRKFEAVIGSDVTRLAGLKLGDKFKPSHDAGGGSEGHEHAEEFEIVGVLAPTRTANDRAIFIPLVTTFALADHDRGLREQEALRQGITLPPRGTPTPKPAASAPPATTTQSANADPHHDHDADHKEGHKDEPKDGHEDHKDDPKGEPATAHADEHHDHAHGDHPEDEHDHEGYVHHPDGTIDPKLPKEDWVLSAILVKARSPQHANLLEFEFRTGSVGTAVRPAEVMANFFKQFLDNITTILLIISILVSVVAGVGILVSIYNSVAARMREIAILRALGATRRRVLTLICVEAGLIGLIGGVCGLLVGHAIGAIGSAAMDRTLGQGFNWIAVGPEEIAYLAGVVIVAVLAGLVPAMKAYRTPVATNLAAV
jgi:putative ABC transport system permease protein